MGDKDKPFSFEGFTLGFIDGDGFKEMPIVENSVEHWGYYDAPELRKSMESISYGFNIDKPDMTQFGKILDIQIQSQVDNAMRSSVILQSEPKINKPKNLKYPNKKRARRIWNKWRNRFGVREAKYYVIPKATIKPRYGFLNGQLMCDVQITAEKISE